MTKGLITSRTRYFRQLVSLILWALLSGGGGSIASLEDARAVTSTNLEIYFIEVGGGQSTLLVTPNRESLLIDAGWPGDGKLGSKPGDPSRARDANRILAAARDAGLKQIDYLLITHFHADHDGGVPELAQLLPLRHFIDHGSLPVEAQTYAVTKDAFEAYLAVRNRVPHIEPKPGDRLPLKDIGAVVVTSAATTITRPLAGAGEVNPVCGGSPLPALDPLENPRSTGILVTYGKFRFLDVGDLSGRPLFDLVCPRNLLGTIDAYLVPHHGNADAAEPATFAAFKPRVAIMDNGLREGGSLATYELLHRVRGLEDVWQLDYSEVAGGANFATERIANLEAGTAYWVQLSAHKDGSFRVLNGRSGAWTNYSARGNGP
jgi:competence protein ComEC